MNEPEDFETTRAPGAEGPLRFSRLRLMSSCPAKYRHGYVPSTSSMDVGSAVHSHMLTGKTISFYPGKVRNGAAWEKYESEHSTDLILTKREYAQAKAMEASIKRSPLAMQCLEGVREKTILFDLDGRPCRGTPDVVGDTFITELKTGETSDPRKFAYKVRDFCYHGQLAWYDQAVGGRKDHFVVAVEAKPPYVVTVFRLLPPSIEQGRKLIRLWLEQLKNCEASNEWPGYCQSIVDLDVSDAELTYADGDESDVPIT
jgi:PDDEXK-like domain of unknown function (DUF3799)